MPINIVHDDETLRFYKSRGMTKYDANDIRTTAMEYNVAEEAFQAAIEFAHIVYDPYRLVPEIKMPLGVVALKRYMAEIRAPFCRIEVNRTEIFPLTVWERATTRFSNMARQLTKLTGAIK